jgi:hypothetical protein
LGRIGRSRIRTAHMLNCVEMDPADGA